MGKGRVWNIEGRLDWRIHSNTLGFRFDNSYTSWFSSVLYSSMEIFYSK